MIVLQSSSLTVLADGPLNVTISGPASAPMGTVVSLQCSAYSRPTCDFFWYINTQVPVLTTGPVVIFPATKAHEGNYTCVAKNPVTGISLPQSQVFVVGE